ncbi:MAG: MFS transporter [Acidiferrobacterales bacterium]
MAQSLLPILSVNFVGTLGFSIVLPFLVFLVTKWGGNALIYGLLGATYSVFQLIGAPILGRWSDRYGRRKILLLSQLGTLASWAIFLVAFLLPTHALIELDSPTLGQFALTLPLIVLFVARAADGLTGGNVSVANAYLADITEEDQRSENFGKMAISGNLGFILGPAVAGLLGATIWGEVLPVVTALVVSLIASLVIAFGLKESNPCVLLHDPEPATVRKIFGQETKECFRIEGANKASARELLKIRCLPVLLAIYFLVMAGFSFFYIAFPIHAVKGLAWSVTQTGAFFATLSLLMVVVQGPILARAAKILSDQTLVIWGSLILSLGFVFFVSGETALVYLGAALTALGNGLMWPSVMSRLAERAGQVYQGSVQGFASSVGAVASIVGLVAGGLLYNWLGPWVFSVAAITTLIVFGVAASVRL